VGKKAAWFDAGRHRTKKKGPARQLVISHWVIEKGATDKKNKQKKKRGKMGKGGKINRTFVGGRFKEEGGSGRGENGITKKEIQERAQQKDKKTKGWKEGQIWPLSRKKQSRASTAPDTGWKKEKRADKTANRRMGFGSSPE